MAFQPFADLNSDNHENVIDCRWTHLVLCFRKTTHTELGKSWTVPSCSLITLIDPVENGDEEITG